MNITVDEEISSHLGGDLYQYIQQPEVFPDCNDSNNTIIRLQKKKEKIILVTAILALSLHKIPMLPNRSRNLHRDRDSALVFVESWDDEYFQRQMRLCREDFNLVVRLISPKIEKNEAKAKASSGSTINPYLRLLITCRILAGKFILIILFLLHSFF